MTDKLKEGDIVRLTKAAKRLSSCPKERDNNVTTTIATIDEDNGACSMVTDLAGCRYWNLEDLEPANQCWV